MKIRREKAKILKYLIKFNKTLSIYEQSLSFCIALHIKKITQIKLRTYTPPPKKKGENEIANGAFNSEVK